MCQVHIGAYVSLLEPEKNDYTACCTGKTTTFILHGVPITTHMHVRLKSIGKNRNKKRKEGKRKGRKEKKRKKARKGKERKDKKDKARRGSKERKREKTSY